MRPLPGSDGRLPGSGPILMPLRLLLIERDPEPGSVLNDLIADSKELSQSLELATATRINTACQRLANEPFDAVLLDLDFPPENGVEVFLKVHQRRPELPIVILAGPQELDAAQQALFLGASDYLLRGALDGRRLETVVRHAVEQNRVVGQFERLLASDAAARLILGDGGAVLYANRSAEALLHRKLPDLEGKPWSQPLCEGRIELDVPKLGRRLFESTLAPVLWRKKPARLLTLRDVSDSRELSDLRSRLAANFEAVEAKDQLINGVSHEMRNPLTIIKTALYALKGKLAGPLTPQQEKFLDMAARNVERQIRMVENVLDLGRIRSEKSPLALQEVQLRALIEQLAEEFQLASPSPRLELDLSKELPPVRADADLIGQVLRNLLDNASRFAKEKVTLRACADGNEILLSVIDDGVGIPKEHLGELFQQYVQLHRPSGRGYKGTGLGLAICREIVMRHGGRIWAESVFGKGSRFHFSLPLSNRENVIASSNSIYPAAIGRAVTPAL